MSLYQKLPNYIGHVSQFKPIYRQMPQLTDLNITRVMNTTITCPKCFGQKINYADHLGTGHLEAVLCPICGGKGIIHRNSEGG